VIRLYVCPYATVRTVDASVAARGGVTWGLAAITAANETAPGQDLVWHPVAGGAAGSGELGWSVGEAIYRPGGDGHREIPAKYLTVWARQPDGSWRWVLDIGNLRPTAVR